MKVNPGFSLQIINDIPYILPYGQNIADYKNGVRLNETGLFLWNSLQSCETESELLKVFCEFYEAEEEEDVKQLKTDMESFLNMLRFYAILEPEEICAGTDTVYLNIAGVNIRLQAPSDISDELFSEFKASAAYETDLDIQIICGEPGYSKNGQLIIRNKELLVIDAGNEYILLFPEAKQIYEGRIAKHGDKACVYIQEDFDDTLKNDLFHAIRLLFLYLAQLKGMFVIHSASLLYKDKMWIFAGHSGNGKSTHTNLWQEIYNADIINGDLNLICAEGEKIVSYGIPWCGTSGIYSTDTYVVGGIVFIGRSVEDRCEELSVDEKILLLTQHMISPAWSEEMLKKNLKFSAEVAGRVPACRLKCTKTKEAVNTIKKWIDSQKG